MFELFYHDPLWVSIGLACLAVVIIGIAKAGFGGAVGIAAVPLMAAAMKTDLAVGVMLPVLITGDMFSLRYHRRHVSWRHMRLLLGGMIVGIAIGTIVWWWLRRSDHLVAILNLLIGGLCLAFVGFQVYRMTRPKQPHVPSGRVFGFIAGSTAATVSTLAHSAGPVISLYMLAQKLDKKRIVGTMVVFFTILNLSKLPTFFGMALITRQTLITSACLIPFVPIGTMIGYWMHERVAEKPFTIIMYLAAVVAAVRMIYKGLGY